MAAVRRADNLDVCYASLDVDKGCAEFGGGSTPRRCVKRPRRSPAKARTRDSMQALEKLTHLVDGEPRITAHPPLIVPLGI